MQITQRIIANNLRLLMKHHKLRQEQTAEGPGVSKQTVSNLLNTGFEVQRYEKLL
jgi:transcriptional regulator with XRE-family HTH domain